MCKSKVSGGMGFRDLNLFNQAMLAKQSWRIIKSPESLIFKILRGRYFRNGDFLKAPIGLNSSQVWKSIVWGRDLSKRGYKWRVGNGEYVYIDEDPWISRQGNRTPMWVPDELKGRRVKELIKSNGEWDTTRIKREFLPLDEEDILAIPLSQTAGKDEIIWDTDSKGIFSVKSAYQLAVNSQRAKEASGSCDKANGR